MRLLGQNISRASWPDLLRQANQAMHQGAYGEALALYHRSAEACPELAHVLASNVAVARRCALRQSTLTGAKNGTRRAAVFAAYSSVGKIEPYVLHYLRHLRTVADYVVVVGDFEVEPAERAKLAGLAEHAIFECHGEYDFGSYKRGHAYLAARGALDQTDELIFCNDSCYGPLQGFAWMFEEMAGRRVDFWGLTQNSEFLDHVQSYFVVMTKMAFLSDAFLQFIRSVARESSVDAVIQKYELGLARALAGQGFLWDTFISPCSPGIGPLLKINTNPTVFPNFLADAGAQLVKVKALADPMCNAEGIHSTLGLIATANLDLFRWICAHQQVPAWRRTDVPFFSVILPVFNRAQRVIGAIDSFLAQAFTNYELVVVDDGSTDGTCAAIVERYPDLIVQGRLRLISYAKNAGVSFARNIGLAAARGEWIAYLDSDNTVDRRFLEVFVQEIQNKPGVECCYAMLRRSSTQEAAGSAFSYQELLIQNYIDLGVVVHRKELLAETGDFDTSLKRLVDWDFFIRLLRNRRVGYIAEVVLNYHDDNVATDRISVRESFDLALRRVREKNNLPFSVTTVVLPDGNPGSLGGVIDYAATQPISLPHTHSVLVFDNSGSDESWAVIERCALNYPDRVRAARQGHEVSDVQNLRDAVGATRSDFVRVLTAGVLPPNEAQLQEQMDYLIQNPDCPQIASESAVRIEHAEALVSSGLLPLSGALYRRHVIEKLVHDGSSRWPPVSFVVPLFNHLAETQAMLVSLQQSLPDGLEYEIIFADDASTDGTGEWLKTLHDSRVKVLISQENRGFAANTNAGAQLSRFELLGLLNNDLLFKPGWLEPMLRTLESPRLSAGLVGNVQTRVADGALDHAGVLVTPLGQVDHVRVLPTSGVAHARVFAVTGACCLIRRDVFEALGGFDEAFVNGGEDIDLCLKVKAKGLHVYMAYHSVVQHHVSLSRDHTSLQNEVNSRLLYQKWRPQLKQELARVWQQGLRGDAAALLGDALDGLQPSFLATPFTAAQFMSESALLRQEARWARLLDQNDPSSGLAHQTRVTGWARSADDTCWLLCSPVLRVLIVNPVGLDRFYVSGKQVNPPQGAQTTVTIMVNGLQAKSFTLGPALHFNLGISHPVVLPGITNCIEVSFRGQYPTGAAGNMEPLDPCSYITLAHLVIDNKLVTHLAGAC